MTRLYALGPIVTGLTLGVRIGVRACAVAWVIAGVVMLVSDFVINHEDVGFHAGVAVITGLLAAGAAAVRRAVSYRRAVGAVVR